MMSNTIELIDVSKSFNNILILDHINLSISKGDILAFTGENGTGKSTIIKMIAGLIYQDEGSIKLFGIDNHSKKSKDLCEYVFESGLGFYGYLSAYENIRYFLGLNKIKFKHVTNEFNSLCHMFQFDEHLNKKVDELSQGNRQKMALILAFLINPKILLLDEPTNGLDQKSIDVLSDILIHKNLKEGMTIILTSHDVPFLQKIHSKISVVSNKQVSIRNTDDLESLCGTILK